MIQEIITYLIIASAITYIIVFLAAIYTIFNTVRMFVPDKNGNCKSGCSSGCASCSLKTKFEFQKLA